MRVKICGITNLTDAMDAIDAGADALGFVFYPKSARYIEPSAAQEIIKKIPPFVQSVGLFVNETAEEVNQIAEISQIDIAQIHFEASENFYKKLKIKALKVVRAQTKEDLELYKNEYRIVDAFVPEYGGEGKRLNIEWFKEIDCSRIILAGGLTANNLEDLKGFNFYSLDVSSGVEVKKGFKDKQKIINFIDKANELS
ncbi:phosphoribosylanthranilate isomerase [Arcobacter sp. 15-2]|uniref:phosphoribosylanthranilate isomerase n=1 Tax=Arcobacter sp. 15-2 TaxID=3374109 RepID=UPI00399D03D6